MNKPETFNIDEAAEYLGCSVTTVRRLCKDKILPYYKIGNRYRFKKSALDEHMNPISNSKN